VAWNKGLGILILINIKVHNSNIIQFLKGGFTFMSLERAGYILAKLT